LREDGSWWAGLLEATGGKLELSKCFYYLLSWKWDKKGNPSPQTIQEQSNNNIRIRLYHDTNNTTDLVQNEISKSHKTLGTFNTIQEGKDTDHYKYLLDKSNDYAQMATFGQINRRQAKIAYTYYYIPSVSYSLMATNLSKPQLDKIQQKSLTQFIRLQGYDACFPRAVLYGPQMEGGVGLEQLYVHSNRSKTQCIITNINSKNSLGATLHTNVNWLQLHSGKSTKVFIRLSLK
jgi:hypothetical protein